ncbi:unnamed protein product [Caenorhabditis brenneri]
MRKLSDTNMKSKLLARFINFCLFRLSNGELVTSHLERSSAALEENLSIRNVILPSSTISILALQNFKFQISEIAVQSCRRKFTIYVQSICFEHNCNPETVQLGCQKFVSEEFVIKPCCSLKLRRKFAQKKVQKRSPLLEPEVRPSTKKAAPSLKMVFDI